jgi:hypothetical protein
MKGDDSSFFGDSELFHEIQTANVATDTKELERENCNDLVGAGSKFGGAKVNVKEVHMRRSSLPHYDKHILTERATDFERARDAAKRGAMSVLNMDMKGLKAILSSMETEELEDLLFESGIDVFQLTNPIVGKKKYRFKAIQVAS